MADDFSEGFEAGWGAARAENIYSMEHDLAEALAERTTPQPLAIGLDREAVARVVSQAVADADDVSNRIHKGGYRANLSDVECLRNHVRRLAACLPAAPTGGRS